MSSTRPPITVLALSEVTRDPRVRRVAGTLAEDHAVTVVSAMGESRVEREHLEGFELLRVPRPMDVTDGALAALHTFCPAASDVIADCDSAVLDELTAQRARWWTARVMRKLWSMASSKFGFAGPGFSPTFERLSLRRMLMVNLKLAQRALETAPEIIYANDLDTLLAAFIIKQKLGVPIVYDAHEIYPEQLAEHQRSDIWHQFYTNLEARLIGQTDRRLTVCDSLGQYFARAYGAEGFVTIRNCPRRAQVVPEPDLGAMHPHQVLYHGAYFPYRGLEEVIHAAGQVADTEFVLRGLGPHESHLRGLSRQLGATDRVRFVDPVKVEQLIPNAAVCEVGLNPFISVCLNTEYALPNKFFEYMAAGLAVVSADLIEMRALTEQLQIGAVYDANSPEALAHVLTTLFDDRDRLATYRKNAWQAARDRYHWEVEAQTLRAIMAEL